MNSPHQREQLPDLLSDALNPTERARVESHLAQCAQCARELRALQRMQRAVSELPVAPPPAAIRAGVRAALHQDQKPTRSVFSFLTDRARPNKAYGAPARGLVWGGAAALGAIGLMLLARPTPHSNDALTQSAPVGEADFASRAAAPQADAASNQPLDSVARAPQAATKKPNPNSNPAEKSNSAPVASARIPQLPPLPPPPPARATKPDNFTPSFEVPTFGPLPSLPPPPPKVRNKTNESEKVASAGMAPERGADSKSSSNATDKPAATNRSKAASNPSPPVKPAPPNASSPTTRDSSPSENREAANQVAPPESPTIASDNRSIAGANLESESAQEIKGAKGDSGVGDKSESPQLALRRRDASASDFNAPAEAPDSLRKAAPSASKNWTGGAVSASLLRAENAFASRTQTKAKSGSPVLTLGVEKAIGNARLVLLLPAGETQVWRGSMNAVPIEIRLDSPDLTAANLRAGQRIRARLEQIDNAGNPKSSTTFSLLWP